MGLRPLLAGFIFIGSLILTSCNAAESPASGAQAAATARAAAATSTKADAGVPPTLSVASTPVAKATITGAAPGAPTQPTRENATPQALSQASPAPAAAPNPVPSGDTSNGTTTINWSVDGPAGGEVYVSTDAGPERLFASGSGGSQEATWIHDGSSYEFRLYRGTGRQECLAVLQVTRAGASASPAAPAPAETQPVLAAEPNPVPWTGPELGVTTSSWIAGASDGGEVYVSTDGGPERLFASGDRGSATAGWICRGATYVFGLYAGTSHQNAVTSITVTRQPSDPSAPAPQTDKCR